jgi:hypothetical protein
LSVDGGFAGFGGARATGHGLARLVLGGSRPDFSLYIQPQIEYNIEDSAAAKLNIDDPP